ncbi:hypothetical protein HanRHA438_Chr03g0126371 [Helianthus annuus]|uniref:Uncharacterized protein n=1 Tax=Helianthus annuus TaxID=4232 RepID=A0A9K3JHP3_HELAN|nr:hypothetical protein HanXRQr2_Chr03g0114441 [Helianthus annuus]KAJ0593304.1 hypothetical protein HanHA300_Chr03g0095501 [Helianthus annuus]KAJ0601157.1 hypothetical protein HanIR_Chr03g0125181 [Helianthus annuus]KAJ0608313.1 hypothetical protein HanHA89_Chr03g0107171 [Helianthus annuus]KAJ0768379.1 hypothetical protein HanLR1_Chr03g0100561 [Helianthus annuus]
MLFDRLSYWLLFFERFVLAGLCYLCAFSGQRRRVFASIVDRLFGRLCIERYSVVSEDDSFVVRDCLV